jgi:hypothetical protein
MSTRQQSPTVDSEPTVTRTVDLPTSLTTIVADTPISRRLIGATLVPITSAVVTIPLGGRTVNSTDKANLDISTTVVNYNINQQVEINKPGGTIDGEVQFSNDGKFAADKDFKYWSDSDTLQLNGWLKTGNLLVGATANLGHVANLSIFGGQNGQILTTNGNGSLHWANISIATSPNSIVNGTSTVSIEPDSNVNFAVNGVANVLTVTDSGAIANAFTSNNYVLGNATTTISTTKWLDAMTATVNPTVLFTAANTISSVDVHITADDGNSKQITKMLSVTKGTETAYNQYGNVTVGSEMASFYMDQSGGLVRVIATPGSANRVDYRLVVTLYS